MRCSLVRPTFVKNVGPDGVLQKCPAEAIIMVPLEWLLRILWMIMCRIMRDFCMYVRRFCLELAQSI